MAPARKRHRGSTSAPASEAASVAWTSNEAGITYLVGAGRLTEVPDNPEHAKRLLVQAAANVTSAEAIHSTRANPAGAFTLCYDAARMALTAVLANQGLRPAEGRGSHLVIEDALRPQFPENKHTINRYTWLRETRHAVEYPDFDTPDVGDEDTELAVHYSREIIDLARRHLTHSRLDPSAD